MGRKITLAVLSMAIFMPFLPLESKSDENDTGRMTEYPDGKYGVSLGEGYELIPDKGGDKSYKLILPSGYREAYQDTRYGPTSKDGLMVFPDYKFPKTKEQQAFEKRRKEEKAKVKEYIFHQEKEADTPKSAIWGVYTPGEDKGVKE